MRVKARSLLFVSSPTLHLGLGRAWLIRKWHV